MAERREELRELLPAYLLGGLDAEDRAAVEQMLVGDAELEAESHAWTETFAELAESASTPVAPDAALRERILGSIQGGSTQSASTQSASTQSAPTQATSPRAAPAPEGSTAPGEGRRNEPVPLQPHRASPAQSSSTPLWLALAASILAAALAVTALWQERASQQQVAELQERLERTQGRISELQLAVQNISGPRRDTILLAGLQDAPGAVGASYVLANEGTASFQAFGLPQLSSDRTYQLWYITDQGAVSAGIFGVDESGNASVDVAGLQSPGNIVTWAVTIEPAGGVPQPTGAMVLRS